jgi:putative membrane protein
MGRRSEEISMIRRQLLTVLAATAFVPALLTAPQSSAATADMGEAEKKHADMTKTVGSLSLATSRLAVEMATAAW